MTLLKKLLVSTILAPALFINVANSQTKKYIELLQKDTANNKVSINLPLAKSRLDSLEYKIKHIKEGDEIKDYFYKAEIKKQEFIIEYMNDILHDKLNVAKILIEKRLQDKELTESVTGEKKLYERYQEDLKQRYIDQDNNLLELVKKKGEFKKKFQEITKKPSFENYQYVRDLIARCKDYAQRNKLEVPEYLNFYQKYSSAKMVDESTEFDLEKSANKKSFFFKTLKPLLESENMGEYLKAASYLDSLELYATTAPRVKLKRKDFLNKKNELIRLIQKEQELIGYDSLANKGTRYSVKTLANDSLNSEGIFEFNGHIVVITNFKSQYTTGRFIQSDGVQKADKILVRYADEHDNAEKHLKANEKVKGGKVIPYVLDGENKNLFPSPLGFYQIRVSYETIRNKSFTKSLENNLVPVNIDTNYYGLKNEIQNKNGTISFYRNNEGSFLKIERRDSTIIISEYDDKSFVNTNEQDHNIDRVRVIHTKGRKKKGKNKKTSMAEYYFKEDEPLSEERKKIFQQYNSLFRKYYNISKEYF